MFINIHTYTCAEHYLKYRVNSDYCFFFFFKLILMFYNNITIYIDNDIEFYRTSCIHPIFLFENVIEFYNVVQFCSQFIHQ